MRRLSLLARQSELRMFMFSEVKALQTPVEIYERYGKGCSLFCWMPEDVSFCIQTALSGVWIQTSPRAVMNLTEGIIERVNIVCYSVFTITVNCSSFPADCSTIHPSLSQLHHSPLPLPTPQFTPPSPNSTLHPSLSQLHNSPCPLPTPQFIPPSPNSTTHPSLSKLHNSPLPHPNRYSVAMFYAKYQ